MPKFVKLPVEIEAVQFTGENFEEIQAFVGTRNVGTDEHPHYLLNFEKGGTYMFWPTRDILAEVWDELHSTWVGVKKEQWIIKGVQGEFYPCDPDVFNETYQAVEDNYGSPLTFEQELVHLLNKHGMEKHSNTPDWILGNYLRGVLVQLDCAIMIREQNRLELRPILPHNDACMCNEEAKEKLSIEQCPWTNRV